MEEDSSGKSSAEWVSFLDCLAKSKQLCEVVNAKLTRLGTSRSEVSVSHLCEQIHSISGISHKVLALIQNCEDVASRIGGPVEDPENEKGWISSNSIRSLIARQEEKYELKFTEGMTFFNSIYSESA